VKSSLNDQGFSAGVAPKEVGNGPLPTLCGENAAAEPGASAGISGWPTGRIAPRPVPDPARKKAVHESAKSDQGAPERSEG
jgi:hypothetical protein